MFSESEAHREKQSVFLTLNLKTVSYSNTVVLLMLSWVNIRLVIFQQSS